MRKKLIVASVVACASVASLTYAFMENTNPNRGRVSEDDTYMANKRPLFISILALIAVPEKYERKRISTTGYIELNDNGGIIYLHQEDARNGLIDNGLSLRFTGTAKFDTERVNHKYCLVEGILEKTKTRSPGDLTATISSINRLDLWTDPARNH